MTPAEFWADVLGPVRADWLKQIRFDAVDCEARREHADYDTGTVPEASAVVLRALCEWYQPRRIVEIGTFIGTSALAMLGCASVTRIDTCDKSNHCGPWPDRIVAYPKTKSTTMLRQLRKPVDLFFFDGRIQRDDLPLIQALSTPHTVYAVDDYEGREKGVINAELLQPIAPTHQLIPPPDSVWSLPSRTTVAVLVP